MVLVEEAALLTVVVTAPRTTTKLTLLIDESGKTNAFDQISSSLNLYCIFSVHGDAEIAAARRSFETGKPLLRWSSVGSTSLIFKQLPLLTFSFTCLDAISSFPLFHAILSWAIEQNYLLHTP